MRGVVIVGLIVGPAMWAQTLIDRAKVPSSYRDFDPQAIDRPLRCEVTPIKPDLDFSFRFETGYSINVPMEQYFGPGHAWAILTRVTPEHGKPEYLAARVHLPDVPITTVKTDSFGGFLVGAGRYKVEFEMFDDEDRVCRKQWKIEAKLKHGEHHVQPTIPPNTIADFAGGGLPQPPSIAADAPPFRLTVLLHAAPASPRRFHLRANDRILLMSTLSAVVQQAQATAVRLAVFNFDKQRVIYSNEDFTLKSMGEVNQALNRLELDTIDVQALQNPRGHIDLLASLLNRETGAPKPSNAVVFLGPAARYIDKLPPSAFEAPPEGMRFFYFQYRTFTARSGPMLPDSVSSAVSYLKGRIIQIYSPGQFADAILQLERLAKH
jgi:hypothetical protein